MKTLTKDQEIIRVDDVTAEVKVKSGWKYTQKSQWKQNVRDVSKKEETSKPKPKKKEK